MKIAFAFLCNYVDRLENERVVIVGADLDMIEACSFPAPAPLALVAKLDVARGEPNGSRRLRVEVTTPNGSRRRMSDDRLIEAVRRADGTLAYQFTITLPMIFEQPGNYAFHLVEGSGDMATIPLKVCESERATSHPDLQNDEVAWKEVDQLAPSDEVLGKLADALPAPAEWYNEG